jgi:ATP-dependent Clp protease ATP-binding subunit ClpC
MYERFTDKARDVVTAAQDEARTFRHAYIGTEHLLLGLFRVDDSLAQAVLVELLGEKGIEAAREYVGRIVGFGDDEAVVGQIPFTPRAKRVLKLALREALALGQNYIGTEHVLLGVVRENEGVAARILEEQTLTPEQVRTKVIQKLSGPERATLKRATSSGLRIKISRLKDEALDHGFLELAEELRAIERDMS